MYTGTMCSRICGGHDYKPAMIRTSDLTTVSDADLKLTKLESLPHQDTGRGRQKGVQLSKHFFVLKNIDSCVLCALSESTFWTPRLGRLNARREANDNNSDIVACVYTTYPHKEE